MTLGIRNSYLGFSTSLDPVAYVVYVLESGTISPKSLLHNLLQLFFMPLGITFSLGNSFLLMVSYDISTKSIVVILRLFYCISFGIKNQGIDKPFVPEIMGMNELNEEPNIY